jgi:ABC-type glycerol-3-phosphate transport system substrate-binding protein
MSYKMLMALLLALAAITGLVACGGGDDTTDTTGNSGSATTTAETAPPTITIKNGEPVNGVETLEYSAGEQAEFKVSSDEEVEVHVHGYEIEKKVPANGTVTFSFPAELEGIYEVELHPSEEQIAELRVNP